MNKNHIPVDFKPEEIWDVLEYKSFSLLINPKCTSKWTDDELFSDFKFYPGVNYARLVEPSLFLVCLTSSQWTMDDVRPKLRTGNLWLLLPSPAECVMTSLAATVCPLCTQVYCGHFMWKVMTGGNSHLRFTQWLDLL